MTTVLVCCAAAALALVIVMRVSKASWRQRVTTIEWKEHPGYSPAANEIFRAVYQDFPKREQWGSGEADYLCALLDTVKAPNRVRANSTVADAEPVILYNAAAGCVSERFRIAAPIEKSARPRLVAALIGGLDAKNPDLRVTAAGSLVSSGLALHPDIRARLERQRSDPDQEVAKWTSAYVEKLATYESGWRVYVTKYGLGSAIPENAGVAAR